MNKADLVAKIAEDHGITKADAERITTNVLDSLVQGAVDNGRASVGRHIFTKKERQARMGRNPQTGEAIQIPSRIQVVYKNSSIN